MQMELSKDDWNYVRSHFLLKKDIPSSEDMEKYQLFAGYLGAYDVVTCSQPLGKKQTSYPLTEKGIELASLVKDESLWQRAKEFIEHCAKLGHPVTPNDLFHWLKRNQPKKPETVKEEKPAGSL